MDTMESAPPVEPNARPGSIQSLVQHPGLRKNGKPQSCEPCRKSKLACDHCIPCGRCARLQRSAQCIYDPAPMTSTSSAPKKRKISPTTADAGRPEIYGPRIATAIPARGGSSESASPYSFSEGRAKNLPSFWSAGLPRKGGIKYRPGFQGRTAFSAILNEYQPSLGAQDTTIDSAADAARNVEIDPLCIELGAEILSYLPSANVARRALRKYFEKSVSSSLHLPTLWHFHESFWAQHETLLEQPRTHDSISRCAREMSRSCVEKPFPNTFASSREYLNALCNRWELLGVIFTAFAAIGQMMSRTDDIYIALLPPGVDAKDLGRTMLECAEACSRLVDQLDTGLNVLVAFLAYRCSALQICIGNRGDTNYTYWRRNVQLCGDATAMGLHRLIEPPIQQPGSLLFLEQQKRVFVAAFTHDKHMAVFLGRPPTLSKRYITTAPVLDAEDEMLMHDDLELIKASLNEHGYNKHGHCYRSTFVRAVYFASLIYEDILELSLGAAPVDNPKVRAIKQQMEESYRQQPACFHQRVCRDLFTLKDNHTAFSAVEIQLIHLHQNLLLDRIEHGTENLHFGTAEEMLRIVLTFWNEREMYPGHEDDNHWTICCYGIPAASAIAVGLWKASDPLSAGFSTAMAIQNPNYSWRNSRSENIQNLSLFIAALEWIKPIDGNFELCQRTKRMLKDILDRILAPNTQTEPLEVPGTEGASLWDLDTFSLAGMPSFGGVNADDPLGWGDWLNAPRANFS